MNIRKKLPVLLCLAAILLTVGCAAAKPYENMEEFIRSDGMQERISALAEAGGGTYRAEICGEGNRMICRYTFLKEVDEQKIRGEISKELEKAAPHYQSAAQAASLMVREPDPIVSVAYYTKDGEKICSAEFHAK